MTIVQQASHSNKETHSRVKIEWIHWTFIGKLCVTILTPILLLPLIITINTPEAKAGYVMVLMIIYWMFSLLPLATTSLLPIALLPLLGLMDTKDVCSFYFHESNVVFFCGVALALGVEQSNLHQRIALRALLLVGTDSKWIMLALMLISMLISMWISNSAVVAMLLPIVRSLLKEQQEAVDHVSEDICESARETGHPSENYTMKAAPPNDMVESKCKKNVHTAMNISVLYAASMGGGATLIGSTACLVLKKSVEELYPNAGIGTLTFPSYMGLATPIAIINIILTWFWLTYFFLGFRSNKNVDKEGCATVKNRLLKQYKELGPVTFHQIAVAFLFSVMILLWFFRNPKFIPGWISIFYHSAEIGDASSGIIIVVLAFFIPAHPLSLPSKGKTYPTVLDWSHTEKNLQWGVLLLLGGGYALAEAIQVSKLSEWIGNQLIGLQTLPPFVIMLITCLIVTTFTEVCSNTVTAAIFLPVLAKLGEGVDRNPLYFMIPAAINSGYPFMLQIGAPENAMVFSETKIKSSVCVKVGLVVNVFSLLISCGMTAVIGDLIYDWEVIPFGMRSY